MSYSNPPYAEAISLDRSDRDQHITITLRLDTRLAPNIDETLTLLSSWWLRWIPSADCCFRFADEAWLAQCHLPPDAHRLLSPVLRDLSAIKNVVCV